MMMNRQTGLVKDAFWWLRFRYYSVLLLLEVSFPVIILWRAKKFLWVAWWAIDRPTRRTVAPDHLLLYYVALLKIRGSPKPEKLVKMMSLFLFSSNQSKFGEIDITNHLCFWFFCVIVGYVRIRGVIVLFFVKFNNNFDGNFTEFRDFIWPPANVVHVVHFFPRNILLVSLLNSSRVSWCWTKSKTQSRI